MIENDNFKIKTEKLFEDANFIKDLGIKVVTIKKGFCETALDISDKHRQQHNFIHAGVIATMADHTAGAAGTTLIKENEEILTIEFKINFIRPAKAERLRCISEVIRSGKVITVAESDVYAIDNGKEKLVSKAIVTLTAVKLFE